MDTPPFKKLRSLRLSSPHQFLLTPTNLTIINDNSFTVLNSLPLKTIFYKNSEILKNVKKVVKLGEFDLIINDFNIFCQEYFRHFCQNHTNSSVYISDKLVVSQNIY